MIIIVTVFKIYIWLGLRVSRLELDNTNVCVSCKEIDKMYRSYSTYLKGSSF